MINSFSLIFGRFSLLPSLTTSQITQTNASASPAAKIYLHQAWYRDARAHITWSHNKARWHHLQWSHQNPREMWYTDGEGVRWNKGNQKEEVERKDAKQNETEWKKQRREAESGTEGEAESGGGGREAVWLSKTSMLWNSNGLRSDWLLRLIYKCELTAEDEWKQTFWFCCQQSLEAHRHIIHCHVMQLVTVILAHTRFVWIKCWKKM